VEAQACVQRGSTTLFAALEAATGKVHRRLLSPALNTG